MDSELASLKFTSDCTPAYLDTIRSFVSEKVVAKIAGVRRVHGLFDALAREAEWDTETDFSLGASGKKHTDDHHIIIPNDQHVAADIAAVENRSKVTEEQLRTFTDMCWVRYVKARIEPGIWFHL